MNTPGSDMAFMEEIDALKSELSATKEKLEAAEKRIRESMEQETVIGDLTCNESDGCPTETAVLKREWRRLQRENAELRKKLNEFDSIGLAICALASNSGVEDGHDGWSLHMSRLRNLLN